MLDDDENPLAAAAVRGLEHEALMVLEELGQLLDLAGQADHAEQSRHGDAAGDRQLLGLQLVVDQGIEVAGIVLGDIAHVAPVHADDPLGRQFGRADQSQHYSSLAKGSKRRSSVRR